MERLTRIGLAVSHSYAYYRGVLRGVVRYAETRPRWLFTANAPEQHSLPMKSRNRVSGLIASIHVPELAETFSRWRRPVVNVSAVLPGLRFPRVGVDNSCVGRLAAEHFLERGLQHFAFVGPPDHMYSIERGCAYCQSLQKVGHAVSSYHMPANRLFDPYCQRWNMDRGVYRWLRGLPKPVGVFAASDDWAVQISEVCRHAGLRLPEDVALLGVDDDDLDCELTRPQLSSIMLPAEQIGFEAAALLDRLLEGKKPPAEPVLIPPTGVATRRSTEVLAIENREVIAAVRYIREFAHLPLRVTDVIRQVSVGRRTLERDFHDALGWGVGEEIRRAHLELAKRLLARTELPMKAIAREAGFSDYRHMAVVFRQEQGQTPTAYRRQVRG